MNTMSNTDGLETRERERMSCAHEIRNSKYDDEFLLVFVNL